MDFLESHAVTIVTILVNCGIMSGVLKFAYSKFKKYIDRAEARDNATRSLCRAEMISICHKAQKENCIAYYNLENLEHLFEAYKSLGGNGAMEKLYNKTIKLPQERDD